MKLYWRYKKDGKWTWKPYSGDAGWPRGADIVIKEEEE
jgi:hypothetical protein